MARAKLLTAASETNCGVWISKPSVGDFTLKRFPFTHCPLHQSEGPPESRHQEQLPSDPASGCWFILFGLFREDGAAFDRSGSRTWMRSLAKTAWEERISQLEKRLKLPLAGVALPVLHSYCWGGCHIHWDMWKMAHFRGKRGAIHAKSIPSSRQKFLDTPVYAAVPSDQITPTLLQRPCFFLPLILSPPHTHTHNLLWMCQEPQMGLPLTGEIGRGKETWGGT